MKGQDLTKENDLIFHLKDDWRKAHGVWEGVQDYLDRNMLRLNWKTTPQLLTLTNDGEWHDLDITAYTSATCRAVLLAVRETSGGRWANFYTRIKGSSADYEGIAGFSYITSTVEGHTHDVLPSDAACQIIQKIDVDGVFQYKLSKEGTFDVYIVGYFDAGATGGSLSPYLSPHTHPGSDITTQVQDADTVDGLHASQIQATSNADTVDGQHAAAFATASHHGQHESGGGDDIKLDDLKTPDDNADLDASPAKHGLEAKGTGQVYDVRLGNNTWNRYLRKTFVQIEDEFVGGKAGVSTGESGTIGDLGWDLIITAVSGSAAQAPLVALDANHIGVLELATGNAAGTAVKIALRGNVYANRAWLPSSIDEVEYILQVPDNTEEIIRIGLFNYGAQSVGGGTDRASVWFDYDSSIGPNWYASSCGVANDPGTTDTGVACVNGNWYVLKIKRVSSAQWDFYINDVLKISRTTKLPDEAYGFCPEYWVKTLRTAAVYVRKTYIDYFRMLCVLMSGNRYT